MECIVTRVLRMFLSPKHFILSLLGCDACLPSWGFRPVALDICWTFDIGRASGFVSVLMIDECLRTAGEDLHRNDRLGPPSWTTLLDAIHVASITLLRTVGFIIQHSLPLHQPTLLFLILNLFLKLAPTSS
jgi:hypothetical protein